MFHFHFSASLWKGFLPGSFWRGLCGTQGLQGQHSLFQDLIIVGCRLFVSRCHHCRSVVSHCKQRVLPKVWPHCTRERAIFIKAGTFLTFVKAGTPRPNKQGQREGQRHKQVHSLSGSGQLFQALPAEL